MFQEARRKISTIKGLPEDNTHVINELNELKSESERANANGKLSLKSLCKYIRLYYCSSNSVLKRLVI